jgi:hypothetical protein
MKRVKDAAGRFQLLGNIEVTRLEIGPFGKT